MEKPDRRTVAKLSEIEEKSENSPAEIRHQGNEKKQKKYKAWDVLMGLCQGVFEDKERRRRSKSGLGEEGGIRDLIEIAEGIDD